MRSKLLNDRERQALRLPGCLGVASDLVQCDPAYRGIVENLLGRAVIAADYSERGHSHHAGGEPLLPPGDPGGRDALRRLHDRQFRAVEDDQPPGPGQEIKGFPFH